MNMTLQDRLSLEEGWVYMTGMQALVRLPIQQRMRDAAAGLNTGGYISGYRGWPMGTYDGSNCIPIPNWAKASHSTRQEMRWGATYWRKDAAPCKSSGWMKAGINTG
jgi:hypothetical protein